MQFTLRSNDRKFNPATIPTRRGYSVVELSGKRCLVRLRTLDDVRDPQSGIRTLRTFAVEDGRPGAQPA